VETIQDAAGRWKAWRPGRWVYAWGRTAREAIDNLLELEKR
jgi:ribulose-5-phosphate 4-epimerase/fuculose-1-phosphate aldolase